MKNYDIIDKIDDPQTQGRFTGMVVSRKVGIIFRRVEYSLTVRNNESGNETREYLMDSNEGMAGSGLLAGGAGAVPSILYGAPVFGEDGLAASVNAWTHVSTFPPEVKKEELRRVVIPRKKFPK